MAAAVEQYKCMECDVILNEDEAIDHQCLIIEKTNDNLWDDNATKLLLDKYEYYLLEVGPLKKFKTKKRMWQQIASDLKNILEKDFTHVQVENRYKTILKRKKEAVNNNTKTGTQRQTIPYEEELNKSSAIDDSIEPQVLRSGNKAIFPKKRQINYNSDSEGPDLIKEERKRSNSLVKTLEDIYKKKEENKERRHKEKIELLKLFLEKKSE